MSFSVEVFIPNKPQLSKTIIVESARAAAEKVINNIYVNFSVDTAETAITDFRELTDRPVFFCNIIPGAYVKVNPATEHEIQNNKVLALMSPEFNTLLDSLPTNLAKLSHTKKTVNDIIEALSKRATDILACLDALANITTNIVATDTNSTLPEIDYPYQGDGELYNQLDDIRHEYRMMSFTIKEQGITADTSASKNNIVCI